VGNDCLIGANTRIFDNDGYGLSSDNVGNRINATGKAEQIFIEDNVWVGINCIILREVAIGEGSIIAVGSVVTTDVPSGIIVDGNPAKVIKGMKRDYELFRKN
jgi:acetyltransferase-like isoleucine patch superfamily enzyme